MFILGLYVFSEHFFKHHFIFYFCSADKRYGKELWNCFLEQNNGGPKTFFTSLKYEAEARTWPPDSRFGIFYTTPIGDQFLYSSKEDVNQSVATHFPFCVILVIIVILREIFWTGLKVT